MEIQRQSDRQTDGSRYAYRARRRDRELEKCVKRENCSSSYALLSSFYSLPFPFSCPFSCFSSCSSSSSFSSLIPLPPSTCAYTLIERSLSQTITRRLRCSLPLLRAYVTPFGYHVVPSNDLSWSHGRPSTLRPRQPGYRQSWSIGAATITKPSVELFSSSVGSTRPKDFCLYSSHSR